MGANKDYDKILEEIINHVKESKPKNKREVYLIKKRVCEKYGLRKIPSDSKLVVRSGLAEFSRKPTRKLSGVSVIAVMTSPAKCPHGRCVFCPGGVEYMTPQSYTGKEPAALRAKMNDYDAYKQVKNRLVQYKNLGQEPSKVELIVMGGTFTSRTKTYQKKFITDCLRAMNNSKTGSLKEMQKLNETALHRCIGLTIETRPDQINHKIVKQLLKYGVTRVELGVQSVYDSVLKKSERGHSVRDTVKATKLLKDAGFKINYHMMTNLPGSGLEKDFEAFKTIFSDKDFMPDMVKIYPTLLIKGTKLYDMYKSGLWTPYSLKDTVELIARIKRIVPSFVRIMRVQRDIPSYLIEQDLKSSNLRELVKREMELRGWRCSCIRCREAGRNKGDTTSAKLRTTKYNASGGVEHFIEYTDHSGILFGFIRLRVINKTVFVRELHVYGEQVPLGGEPLIQHRGIGKLLMNEAEKLAKKVKASKICVISGVGVREYYRKLGYDLEGAYMAKKL